MPAEKPTAGNTTSAANTTTVQRANSIKTVLADTWIPNIYRERILKLRTRSYQLGAPARNGNVEIQHTLLGVELKLGRRRLLCPDLATARYLSVFARAGCNAVALPYDITGISHLADQLESSWHRMLLMADSVGGTGSGAFRARLRRLLISEVRDEILAAGAGTEVPSFKQSTKQRPA
ncbi:MAG: hypothetical protein ABI596_13545 [Pyrinomonadaceae bacterium]